MATRQELAALQDQGKYSKARNRVKLLQEARSALKGGDISQEEFHQIRLENSAVARRQEAEQKKLVLAPGETIVSGTSQLTIARKSEPVEGGVSPQEAAVREAREGLRPVGMSVEEFRVREGYATPEERANLFVEQFELKRATSPYSALIPTGSISPYESRKAFIKEQVGGENDTGNAGDIDLDILNDSGVGALQETKTSREERIEKLLARERNLEEYKETFYDVSGLSPGPRNTLFSFGLETGKALLRVPIDVVSSAPVIGGRIAFAGEALTFKEGREELVRAGKETLFGLPSTLASSFNPTTPEGLVNVGITGLAIKGGVARTKQPSIIAEDVATRRITTESLITDITAGELKAVVGKKVVKLTASSEQLAFLAEEGVFDIRAKGQVLKEGQLVATTETLGRATKVERGFDTLFTSKITPKKGGVKTQLGLSQTAELVSEPVQTFKEISIVQDVTKRPLSSARPKSVSTGITTEVSILDIPQQRNILRKIVKSESGQPVATEQILSTQNIGISQKLFEKQFTGYRQPDLSRTMKERVSFAGGQASTVFGDVLALEQKGAGLPTPQLQTRQLLRQALKESPEVVAMTKTLEAPPVVSLIDRGAQKTTYIRATRQRTPQIPSLVTVGKAKTEQIPMSESVSFTRTRPLSFSRTRASSFISPVLGATPFTGLVAKSLPSLDIGTRSIAKQKQGLVLRTVAKQRLSSLPRFGPGVPFAFGLPKGPGMLLPPLPELEIPEPKYRVRRGKGKRKTRNVPSFTRELLELKLEDYPDNITFTGFELR